MFGKDFGTHRTSLPFSTQEDALDFALIHRIDLFLVDIILRLKERNDFSSIQFAEKIKQCLFYGTAEIVFITTLAGLEVELLHRVHCYDYIEKPIDEMRVKRIVTEILILLMWRRFVMLFIRTENWQSIQGRVYKSTKSSLEKVLGTGIMIQFFCRH